MTICDRCGREAEHSLAAVGVAFRRFMDPGDIHYETRKPVFEGPVDLCGECFNGMVASVTAYLTEKLPPEV